MNQEKQAQEIIAAIKALDPGEKVELFRKSDSTPVYVTVMPVKFRDVSRYAARVSEIIPKVISIVQKEIIRKVSEAKTEEERNAIQEADVFDILANDSSLIGQLVPVLFRDISDLVSASVEPKGVFDELPFEYAAPVVKKWVEMNVLNEGKLKAWSTAISDLWGQAKKSGILKEVSQTKKEAEE